jgi:hypothetical protein
MVDGPPVCHWRSFRNLCQRTRVWSRLFSRATQHARVSLSNQPVCISYQLCDRSGIHRSDQRSLSYLVRKSSSYMALLQEKLTFFRVFGIPTILGAISTVVFWFMYKKLDDEEFSLISASEQEEKEHSH